MIPAPSLARSLALVTIPFAACALAACSDAAAPNDAGTAPREIVQMTTIPVPPAGASDIRGVVIHASPQGASLGVVAGARIAISRVDVDPGATDTATATKRLTPIGTVVSGADGSFALANVGRAYFALDVTPPAGSGLKAGRAWSVSLLPSDPARAQVYLYSAP